MKVLLVDDESAFLEQAEIFLEKELEELEVDTALSAEEGLQKLSTNDYDAIVSDYQMPEMDGLDFLETVREERKSEIPFIVFTGKGREEVAIEALNLGVDRYLQKGGDPKSQYGVLAQAIVQEIKYAEIKMERAKVEAELSSLVKESEDPVFIVDGDFRFQFANQAELERHNLEKEELIGSKFRDLHPEEDSQTFEKKVRKVLETGEPQRQEVEHESDGKYYVRTLSPIENPRTGEFDRVSVISKDITDRKEREKELIKTREEKEKFFDAIPDIAAVISPDHEFIEINEEGAENLGMDREELIGEKCYRVVHGRDEPIDNCPCTEALRTGKPDVGEEFSEGGSHYIAAATPIIGKNGEVESLVHTVKDITDRKKAEDRFRTFFEEMDDAVFIQSLEDETFADILEANPAAEEHTGYSREELMGMNIVEDLSTGEPLEIDQEEVTEKLLSGEKVSFTQKHERKDGSERWVETVVTPIDYGGGKAGLSVNRDVTERNERERDLRREERKFRAIFENSPTAIALVERNEDSLADIVRVNDAFCEMLNYDRDELESLTVKDITHPDDYEQEEKLARELHRGEIDSFQIEKRYLTKEGEVVWGNLTTNIVHDDEGNYLFGLGIVQDITERKKAEERYSFESNLLNSLLSNADDFVYFKDREGRYVKFSKSYAEALGLSVEEAIGKKPTELWPESKGEDILEEDLRVMESEEPIVREERQVVKSDGERIWNTVTKIPRYDEDGSVIGLVGIDRNITERKKVEEKVRELHETASELEGAESEDEICQIAVDAAEEILEFSVCSVELLDESGKLTVRAVSTEVGPDDYRETTPEESGLAGKTFLNNQSYLVDYLHSHEDARPVKGEYRSAISVPIKDKGVFQAISSEPNHFDESDLELAELLMDHVSGALERVRTEEREEFLHSLLRHDVRNKAQIVEGYLELLRETDLSEEQEELVEKAMRGSEDGIDIIEKVRTLREVDEREEIEDILVGPVIKDVIEERKSQASEEGIEVKFEDFECEVKAGTLLEELFSNLIENSIVHSGCDKIRVSSEKTEEECVVTIDDDGEGVPDERKKMVFERGFKAGESGGSGLGLYLVKEIAENYGGKVEVKDSEHGGARIDVHLQKA